MKFRKMSVSFAPQPGISGIFSRMESAPGTFLFSSSSSCARNRPFLACTFCFSISDHVMPSWEFTFFFFISYAYICTCIRRHLKESIPLSSLTWSARGNQNIQAIIRGLLVTLDWNQPVSCFYPSFACVGDTFHEDALMIFDKLEIRIHICKSRSREDDFSLKFRCHRAADIEFDSSPALHVTDNYVHSLVPCTSKQTRLGSRSRI